METANITLRKPMSKSSNDLSAIWDISNECDPFDTSSQSLPSVSINDDEQIKTLQEQIVNISLQLKSAHEEIEKISLENTELKRTLLNHEKNINLLKKIGISDSSYHNLSSPIVKKIKSTMTKTPTKANLISPNKNICQIIQLEKKIKLLEQQLSDANNHIKQLNMTIENIQSNSQKCLELNIRIKDTHTLINNPSEQTGPTSDTTVSVPCINKRRRIIIIADQLGRGVRQCLQKLVGEEFLVTAIWKPCAKLCDLFSSGKEELQRLTKNDYVILMGGVNETNPFELKYFSETWVQSLKNTNVLICETPFNQYLNEKKLNYDYRYICNRHRNCVFVDMDFGRFLPYKSQFPIFVSRYLLKEILRIEYQNKIQKYCTKLSIRRHRTSYDEYPKLLEKSTQTLEISQEINDGSLSCTRVQNNKISVDKPNEFFRI